MACAPGRQPCSKIPGMEPTLAATLWRLAGLAALVGANGLFVAAEFSIVTVRKTRVDQLIAEAQELGMGY